MKVRVFEIWIALMIGLFSTNPTFAQDEKADEPKRPDLKAVDVDSDGVATLDELKTFLQEEHFDDWAKKAGLKDAELEPDALKKLFSEKYVDAFKALDRLVLEIDDEAEAAAEAARNQPPTDSISMMNERFQSRKPAIGSRIEELTAIGEDGEEVDFEELRGKHVVIVFGCLT